MFLTHPEGKRTKGWFWTPYQENTDIKGADRWIPVSRNPVVPKGLGRWGGSEPAKVSADIITFLATTAIEPPELQPGLRHISMTMTATMLSDGKFVRKFGDIEKTFRCPPKYVTHEGASILYCVPRVPDVVQ